jgi:2',3'-cyclic-nucleotide 2'-phosphodiesterase (5'-nucleotidase family)
VRAILEKGSAAVDSIRKPVIGAAAHALEKYPPESPLMNFTADALLFMARKCTGQSVDVAITNKGGLRSNLGKGDITFGDIYNVFPFENTLALLTLNGEQLLQLCGEIASVGGEAISGMRLVITKDGKLVEATVGGKAVEKSRSYRVATSDYLAQGNDKMTTLALGTEREVQSGITLRDLMVQYIAFLTKDGKALSAECDGRITIRE